MLFFKLYSATQVLSLTGRIGKLIHYNKYLPRDSFLSYGDCREKYYQSKA